MKFTVLSAALAASTSAQIIEDINTQNLSWDELKVIGENYFQRNGR